MELVSEVNSAGAAHLCAGNIDAALDSFRHALDLLKLMYDDRKESSVSKSSSPEPWPEEEIRASNRSPIASPPRPVAADHQSEGALASRKVPLEHSHFVYRRALVFDSDLSFADQDWDECLSIFLAMIKFNLGLTFQIKSNELGERALVRALVWYDLSLAHVQETVQTAAPMHLNIVLATMNNMAIVSHDLCNFGKVRQIYQNVLEILTAHATDGSKPNGFEEEDMQGLLLNIILLHAIDAIAPAA